MNMTDEDAFRVLGLPLGISKDAIQERYKQLHSQLSTSKIIKDKTKLDAINAAYGKLMPNKSTVKKSNTSSLCNGVIHNHDETDSAKGDEKLKRKKKKEKQRNNSEDVSKQDSDSNDEESLCTDDHNFFTVSSKSGRKVLVPNNVVIISDKSLYSKSNNFQTKAYEDAFLEANKMSAMKAARQGNKEANAANYENAVQLFTAAIELDSSDHRFYGNRSYCYDQLGDYRRGLQDAEKAISMSPEWPKGHFRRGRALAGLNRYVEAEMAFTKVLKFDAECVEASEEIIKVRKHRIIDMGFTELQASAAVEKYADVQPSLDALLDGEFKNLEKDSSLGAEGKKPVRKIIQTAVTDIKMNPKNPGGYRSLWVGNVLPDVTEKMLTKLFGNYGVVLSIRLMKEKYCAFINYAEKESAAKAMQYLQSHNLCGSNILIKFPEHADASLSASLVLKKTKPMSHNSEENKPHGPVNGEECYYWRTTGCMFDTSCRYLHIPAHKGVDKKSWHK